MGGSGGQTFERRPQQNLGGGVNSLGGNSNMGSGNSGNDMFSRRQTAGGQNRNSFGGGNNDNFGGGQNFNPGMNR